MPVPTLQDSKNISVVIFLLFWATWILIKSRSKGGVVHVPGPDGGHWFWGHELEVFRQPATQAVSKWMKKYGPVLKMKCAFLHHDILVVADNTAVQHILQNCYIYIKSPALRPAVANILGEGIVWAEGDMHKQHRRILQPAFTPESVKGMAPTVLECAKILQQRLTDHVQSSGKSAVNIYDWTSTTTLDVIGKVGFGHDFQFGQSPEAKAISTMWINSINEGIQTVGFIAPLLLRTFPSITGLLIKSRKAQGDTKAIVRRLARAIVRNAKVGGGTGDRQKTDVLSILMRANEQETLPETNLIDNMVTLLMVGHETTASSISFLLLTLAHAPKIQSQLRAELQNAATQPDYLSYDMIHKLEYLDAVTKESMRIHTASPQAERVLLQDDVLPLRNPIKTPSGETLTSLALKAGQVIHVQIMAMQKMRTIWGDDAEEFKPERWINEGGLPPLAERPHGWSGLATFSDGPRNCLGYRLALYEFKVILALLVQHFVFTPTSEEVTQRPAPTIQPVTGGKAGVLPLNVTLA